MANPIYGIFPLRVTYRQYVFIHINVHGKMSGRRYISMVRFQVPSFFLLVFSIFSITVSVSRSVMSNSLQPQGLYPTRLLSPWNFPGKSTGVGCHFLLLGIFSNQGSNLGLPHCRQTLYRLSHQGVPHQKADSSCLN